MPEGDTIHRAARALNQALAGRTVTRFDSVFPRLTRVVDDRPLLGRRVERVGARGKHHLIWFSGDLILRTHMRMQGSWHIYRPGERWQRPHSDMRIVIGTPEYEAVAFTVPVAEFTTDEELTRDPAVRGLGPDLVADDFDADEAVKRIAALAAVADADSDVAIGDALLDQRGVAGIGNIFKSETLFVARVDPFTRVATLSPEVLARLVATARRLMRANVNDEFPTSEAPTSKTTYAGRRTTGRSDPSARLWVYGRAGRPCRRCGTPISRRKQGADARTTYWCERCQPSTPNSQTPTSREAASDL